MRTISGFGAVAGRRLRWSTATVGVLAAAGASGVLAAPLAHAAVVMPVHCEAGQNLQTAINNAPSGATLSVSGTCAGDFTVAGKTLTISGSSTAVLDGQETGTTLSVGTAAQPVTVKLTGLTIKNGAAASGGGLRVVGSTVLLTTSTVTENRASQGGGGILNLGGSVTIQSSAVTGNSSAASGGGLQTVGGSTVLGQSSVVDHNTALNGSGGGLDNESSASTMVSNSKVTNNMASAHGGGAFNGSGFLSAFATQFSGNSPDNCSGTAAGFLYCST